MRTAWSALYYLQPVDPPSRGSGSMPTHPLHTNLHQCIDMMDLFTSHGALFPPLLDSPPADCIDGSSCLWDPSRPTFFVVGSILPPFLGMTFMNKVGGCILPGRTDNFLAQTSHGPPLLPLAPLQRVKAAQVHNLQSWNPLGVQETDVTHMQRPVIPGVTPTAREKTVHGGEYYTVHYIIPKIIIELDRKRIEREKQKV